MSVLMGAKWTVVVALLIILSSLKKEVAGEDALRAQAEEDQLTCNTFAKSWFKDAEISTNGVVDTTKAISTYCRAMDGLLTCVLNVADRSLTEEKKQYNYVVLQYLEADNLAEICSHDKKKLERLTHIVKNSGFEHDSSETLVNYQITHLNEDLGCFQKVHRYCVEKFAAYQASADSQTDYCTGVEKFVNCYQTQRCTTQAAVMFARIINKFSQPLIESYKQRNLCRDHQEL